MPEFVSYLGRLELKRWGLVKDERQQILKKYIHFIDSFDFKPGIEDTYITENRNIVPLRFVWKCNNGVDFRNKMKDFFLSSSSFHAYFISMTSQMTALLK